MKLRVEEFLSGPVNLFGLTGPGFAMKAKRLKRGHVIRWKLDRTHAGKLLEMLDGFGEKCSDTCREVRERLRNGLAKGTIGEFKFEIKSQE